MIDRSIFALPGIKGALAFLVAVAALRALAVVGQAWALATALVNLWYGGAVLDQVGWLALFLVCFVGRQALVTVQESYLERYADARADELRQDLLRTVFTEGGSVVQAHGTGTVATMVLEGVDQVETYIRLILPKTVGVVVVPFVLLVFIFPLDWVSGVIALVAFPFIILYMVILGHTAQDEAAKQHATFQVMSNHFIDSLRGIDTLKLFGRGKAHGKSIYEVSERFREATMKTLRVATLSSTVLDLFSTFSLAAVAIMLGFRLVDGTLVLFPALLVLILVPEYFKPVRDFASDYHASLDGKNALVTIQQLIGRRDEDAAARAARANEAVPAWDADARLEVRDLGFSYPDAAVLHDVSFSVQGFRKVGIVGTSGAGKSTLVNLLGGFAAPTEGALVVNGEDAGTLGCAAWQKQVVYIPQNPYLFHATLRENIAFYAPDAAEDDIERAVRVMGLEDVVAELPDGLDTLIGEGARALSGGQAQRIALARALLDPSRRILLFDEPTAHLDIETELELKERMLPLMEGRLVFFATHRLHWTRDMDLVLVMEDGRIVEAGAPDALLARGGAFARLVSQMGGEAR
ncbi:thiol reductant ABC exporter subunit CydD [Eggerthella sinensis]|uniref:Thiol reductant ABC exporter subunit CydD n=2 Tax=Eggerthella sinensis TaxID=242230 RepID=A0A3N0IUK0_9ACTN|nr:thiol reductant ABC exporter subunit CydD [Eggerthella sinensis]RDB69491.1 thiol reductant ABC exporter subunit CydD [Eggerthella sinensis]RNM40633.1 thiol reductant ABC exporter subunit CydD [Eggerthella sinensis]